jgi:hypothetical protein
MVVAMGKAIKVNAGSFFASGTPVRGGAARGCPHEGRNAFAQRGWEDDAGRMARFIANPSALGGQAPPFLGAGNNAARGPKKGRPVHPGGGAAAHPPTPPPAKHAQDVSPPTSRDVRKLAVSLRMWFSRSMPTACFQTPQTRVALASERLVVTSPDAETREIPLRDVERVLLAERASLSTPACAELLRRRIPVALFDSHGRFLGAFQPAAPDHGAARLMQYQRTLDPAFALACAGRIVAAKIYNQRRVLQRVLANRRAAGDGPEAVEPALARMEALLARCARRTGLDELRGVEGAASAAHFPAWAALFPAGSFGTKWGSWSCMFLSGCG